MKVSINADRGKLKLRWTIQGKRKSFSPRLDDNKDGRRAAEAIARQIELDVVSGNYDVTLNKYRPESRYKLPEPDRTPTIASLWEQYTTYRSKQVQETTLRKQYAPITSTLGRMPHQRLEDAVKIRNWLAKEKSSDGLKRYLTQLSACCKWAVDSQIIESNPFEGMAADVKISKSLAPNDLDIKPFTAEERDRIIEAFSRNRYYSHYTPLVKFLFFTGCRPSEAVALQWNRIYDDHIVFDKAAVSGMNRGFIKEGLKTQGSRKVPMNEQLKDLINGLKRSDSFVFLSPKGKLVDFHNFRNRAWVKTLASLGIEYRKPYQTRHTFITLCLNAGIDAKDIASWVGNSPEMIYRHYAGVTKNLQIPIL